MFSKKISRREFLKSASAGTVGLAAMSVAGAAFAAEESKPKLKPGTYTGTGSGFPGIGTSNNPKPITVEVTVDESSIKDIVVVSHSETAGFGGVALEQMPKQMVDAQSIEIDNFAGATFTTFGFKAAVADALSQAGDIAPFEKEIPLPEHTEESLEVDFVVVGSGICGLSAALSAAETGANVLIVEYLSDVGGKTKGSGGAIMAAGAFMNEEEIANQRDMIDWWYYRSEGYAKYELLDYVGTHSHETVNWIHQYVPAFTCKVGGNSDLLPQGSKTWSYRPDPSGGNNVIRPMYDGYVALGGKTLLNTKATEFIMENGEVKGIIAEGKSCTYTIRSKGGVFMGCGGYDTDREMVAQYSPAWNINRPYLGGQAGHIGTAIKMGQTIGAAIKCSPVMLPGYPEGACQNGNFLALNDKMMRYCDESFGGSELRKWKQLQDGKMDYYSFVVGAHRSEKDIEKLEAALGKSAWKGDTLEELAAAADVDADALKGTIKRWNYMVQAGLDQDFHSSNLFLVDEVGPYYLAASILPSQGCAGGLVINANAEVLDEEGNVIPGLWAAGEAIGEYFYRDYVCGGGMLGMGSTFGYLAGKTAAKRAGIEA